VTAGCVCADGCSGQAVSPATPQLATPASQQIWAKRDTGATVLRQGKGFARRKGAHG